MNDKLKTAWTFIKGWEVFVVAAVAVWKNICHDCPSSGFASSLLTAMGWSRPGQVLPVDPFATGAALVVVYALGQHLWQAYKQIKAGVPLQYVQTEKGAVLATVNTGSVKAVVAELNKETPAETAAIPDAPKGP